MERWNLSEGQLQFGIGLNWVIKKILIAKVSGFSGIWELIV